MNCINGLTIILIIIIIILIITIINNKNNIKNICHKKDNIYDIIGNKYYYGYNTDIDYNKAIDNYNKVLLYDADNENIPEIRKNINNIINHNNINDENHIIVDNTDFGFNYDINDYIIDIYVDDTMYYNNIINNNENIIEIPEVEDNILYNNININEIPNDPIYYNDFENVHDSVVNKTINSSIDKLEKITDKKLDLDSSIKFLYDNLKNNNIDKKENIKKTINYIKDHSNSKIRERTLGENLVLITNKINNCNDKEKQNDMIANLFHELRDCVRIDGTMYCLTGISNRIINSLHGIDDAVIITPKWALREELMRKCGKIREELENTISSNDENFTEKLKECIYNELTKEYVDDNKILLKEDLDKEIQGWIDYV